MSLGSPKLARREQALEATRRRLKRLEIETHRIKAELARLEAEYEDDVADELTRSMRRYRPPVTGDRIDSRHADTARVAIESDAAPRSLPVIGVSPTAPVRSRPPLVRKSINKANPVREATPLIPPPRIVAEPTEPGSASPHSKSLRTAAYRKTASPVIVSLGIHAVALILCVTFTFATLVHQGIPLLASPPLLDEMPERLSEIEITAHKFADEELQNVVSDSDQFNVSDNLQFDPAKIGAGTESLGDMGQLDSLPSDLGTLMAGAGDPGSGPSGGPLGSAVFFGAQSRGNRFVFVVDNSSSMKGGRLETAVAELLKSIDALSPRQSFYVIFVSDQTYPMFYPQPATMLLPATQENKKLLAAWLPKAILASGKNRELIKAMDLAASLQPHAVFLLWDGDMRYSDKVRLDVMTHLTRPNQWNFAIHTLGMGITSLDSEYNLTAIAQAHGGTYRRIEVPTLPQRQRP